jgi:hypothetical protein
MTDQVTDWWAPARKQALADLDEWRGAEYARRRRDRGRMLTGEEVLGVLDDGATRAREIMHPDWVPERPERRMPSLWTIAQYWEKCGTFDVQIVRPICFACTGHAPHEEDLTPGYRWNGAGAYLDRAHLVDRFLGGLDGPQNLVPLCKVCHDLMPMFRIGADAIEWVLSGGPYGDPKFQAAQAELGAEGMRIAVRDGPELMRLWHEDRVARRRGARGRGRFDPERLEPVWKAGGSRGHNPDYLVRCARIRP